MRKAVPDGRCWARPRSIPLATRIWDGPLTPRREERAARSTCMLPGPRMRASHGLRVFWTFLRQRLVAKMKSAAKVISERRSRSRPTPLELFTRSGARAARRSDRSAFISPPRPTAEKAGFRGPKFLTLDQAGNMLSRRLWGGRGGGYAVRGG